MFVFCIRVFKLVYMRYFILLFGKKKIIKLDRLNIFLYLFVNLIRLNGNYGNNNF